MTSGLLLLLLAQAPPELDLAWTGPAGCPSQAEVEVRVVDLVGRPVTVGAGAALSAWGDVRHRSGGFSVDLLLASPRGTETRRLEAGACEALADAVAVIVALALGEAIATPGPTPPAPTRPRPGGPARPSRVVRPRPPAERPPPTSAPISVGLAAGVEGHANLPGPGFGPTLAARIAWLGWAAELGAARRLGVATVGGVGAEAEQWSAVARLCRGVGAWAACLAGEGGAVRRFGAVSPGFEPVAGAPWLLWWDARAEVEASLDVAAGLGLFARGGLGVGARVRVRRRGAELVLEQAPGMSAVLAIGARARFF